MSRSHQMHTGHNLRPVPWLPQSPHTRVHHIPKRTCPHLSDTSTHLHSGVASPTALAVSTSVHTKQPAANSTGATRTHLHSGHCLLLCLGCLSVWLGIPLLLRLLGEGLLLLSHVLGQVSLLLLDALAQVVPATVARVVCQGSALSASL